MFYYKKHSFEHILLFLLFFTPLILRGQVKKKGEDQTKAVPLEQIVKVSPTALIDPFGFTYAAYFEHQLPHFRKWRSLEHEIGYTTKVTGLTPEASGYRLRTAFRQYWKNKCQETGNFYYSLSLMHRQFFDKSTQYLWRANRGYQQNLPYNLRISQQSVLMNVGVTRYFGEKNRFNLDLSAGLGMRLSHVKFKNLPEDAATPSVPDIYESNFDNYIGETTAKSRTHFFLSTAFALKLGYVLQRNPLMTKTYVGKRRYFSN